MSRPNRITYKDGARKLCECGNVATRIRAGVFPICDRCHSIEQRMAGDDSHRAVVELARAVEPYRVCL